MADAPQRSPIHGVGPFFIVRRWRVILCKLLGGMQRQIAAVAPVGPRSQERNPDIRRRVSTMCSFRPGRNAGAELSNPYGPDRSRIPRFSRNPEDRRRSRLMDAQRIDG